MPATHPHPQPTITITTAIKLTCIDHKKRTRKPAQYLQTQIQKLENITSWEGLIREIKITNEEWKKSGCVQEIEFDIQEPNDIYKTIDFGTGLDDQSSPHAHTVETEETPIPIQLHIKLTVAPIVDAKIGMQAGANETDAVLQFRANNRMGMLDQFTLNYTAKRPNQANPAIGHMLNASWISPWRGSLHNMFSVKLGKSMVDLISHLEETRGAKIALEGKRNTWSHYLALQADWRSLTSMNGPESLFAECGQSIKTSLLYVAQSHNRNDPFRPSPGCYWSYGAEWAMPLQRGWMNFLKFDGRIGRSIPLTNWLNLNLNGRSGVMRGDSRMIDRFFVGGPYCIRGFQERGIGSYNRYGSHLYYALGTSLLFPMPFTSYLPFLSDARTQLFVNAGSNAINKPSVSIGAAINIPSPIGQIEAGYVRAITDYAGDRHRASPWYFSVGHEFF